MCKYFWSRRPINVLVFFVMIVSVSCVSQERLYFSSVSSLPATDRTMKTSGFWVSHHPSPDKIILNPEEIKQLNTSIQNELQLTQDILHPSAFSSGHNLKSELEGTLKGFLKRELYSEDGHKIRIAGCWKKYARSAGQAADGAEVSAAACPAPRFYQDILNNLNLKSIPPQITPRYGLIVRYSDQRLLPTPEGLFEKKFDIDFDEIQNSTLDVGTPVIIVHQSRDGKWFYVVSESSSGWVEVINVALSSIKDVENFLRPEKFVVVTNLKADIFLDEDLRKFVDYARMGTRFPIETKINQDIWAVTIPLRAEDGSVLLKRGYIQNSDVHEGFLTYNPRNIIHQAFKLLNAPYGWGGMYGEQDCSAFIQEIFSTIGINLPRNSQVQAKVGKLFAQFDKNTSLTEKMNVLSNSHLVGISTLGLKGHIMLFLGVIDQHAYAIHATWGYREKMWNGTDRVRVLNRVVVSDLSLGEGSHKGSLLERLLSVRMISK